VATLAASTSPLAEITVSEGRVYWLTGESPCAIVSVPADGGAVATLTTLPTLDYSTALAVDSTYAYWTDGHKLSVMRTSLAGGQTVTLASGQGFTNPSGIAIDATHVYWTNQSGLPPGEGAVVRVAIAGGTPETLAAGQDRTLCMSPVLPREPWRLQADGHDSDGDEVEVGRASARVEGQRAHGHGVRRGEGLRGVDVDLVV
jgi:hypothetical protein